MHPMTGLAPLDVDNTGEVAALDSTVDFYTITARDADVRFRLGKSDLATGDLATTDAVVPEGAIFILTPLTMTHIALQTIDTGVESRVYLSAWRG